MAQRGPGLGHLSAVAGAVGALGSLWQPWYRAAAGADASVTAAVRSSGWLQLQHADQVLCAGALLVAVLCVAAAAGRDGVAAGRWITILAGSGLAMVAEHVIVRPLDSDLVAPGTGLWMALGGCAVAMLGGTIVSSATPPPARPLYASPITPFLERPSSSIPPPGAH